MHLKNEHYSDHAPSSKEAVLARLGMYGYEFIADIDGCGSNDSAKEGTTESTTDVLVGLKKAGVAVEVMALKVSGLQAQKLLHIYTNTDYCLVAFSTWIPPPTHNRSSKGWRI